MNRRGFLGSILAAAAAPAIVRADSLMRIVPVDTIALETGELWVTDLIRYDGLDLAAKLRLQGQLVRELIRYGAIKPYEQANSIIATSRGARKMFCP